jgi:hypothetical protein
MWVRAIIQDWSEELWGGNHGGLKHYNKKMLTLYGHNSRSTMFIKIKEV